MHVDKSRCECQLWVYFCDIFKSKLHTLLEAAWKCWLGTSFLFLEMLHDNVIGFGRKKAFIKHMSRWGDGAHPFSFQVKKVFKTTLKEMNFQTNYTIILTSVKTSSCLKSILFIDIILLIQEANLLRWLHRISTWGHSVIF